MIIQRVCAMIIVPKEVCEKYLSSNRILLRYLFKNEEEVMFCPNCGTQIQEGASFCTACGSRVQTQGSVAGNSNTSMRSPDPGTAGGYSRGFDESSYNGYRTDGIYDYPSEVLETLISKLRTSATIWTVVGIFQVIMGVFTLFFGYGLFSLALGVWNLVQSSKQKKNALYFRTNPVGIVPFFEGSKTMTIVFLVLNLVFGAFFGVIGSVYDLTIDQYVLTNRNAFLELERSNGL